MLPIEKQVCSLELAKQLKKSGVKQESLWYWIDAGGSKGQYVLHLGFEKEWKNLDTIYSAFTVAKLGEMLPIELMKNNVHFSLLITRIHIGDKKFLDYGKWGVSYLNMPSTSNVLHSEVDTEANARAKMLLYLIKQGLVNPKDLCYTKSKKVT